MKVYKNQTKQSASLLGFNANVIFAEDSKNGLDIMRTDCSRIGKPSYWEITEFNKETGLSTISIMSEKEYEKSRFIIK